MSHDSDNLTCPSIQPLGISYRDIQEYNLDFSRFVYFTSSDQSKARAMLKTATGWKKNELSKMLHLNAKVEIQVVDDRILTMEYIPKKLGVHSLTRI